jgi:hypothetical protein
MGQKNSVIVRANLFFPTENLFGILEPFLWNSYHFGQPKHSRSLLPNPENGRDDETETRCKQSLSFMSPAMQAIRSGGHSELPPLLSRAEDKTAELEAVGVGFLEISQ